MGDFRSWLCRTAEKKAAKLARKSALEGLFAGLLEQYCRLHEAHGGARFLQIGANDGKTNDPLFPCIKKFRLAGICVEPLPEAFEILRETYREHSNVVLVQRAIGSSEEMMKLYVAGLPENATVAERLDASRKATFSKESAIAKTKKECGLGSDQEVEARLEICHVKTTTLPGLLAEYGHPRVDILQIDAEGEDWNILQQVAVLPALPSLVNLEHKGLSQKARHEMHTWFARAGYLWFEHGRDTCALRPALAGIS
ncbi:FkbM family methyltransferase [Desulfurivibrio dismutans]|uniref:FkbM family methyltransferase n=1 Tax=Desulfurivibrio dismutans TaxID=1398908 RepID=UPI0023DBF13C|nr:FkbM family methyltransferase [Desulfurivibrio alkaliphilus]MDF1614767.1 FkbM family methyltransferase [Desulfurivibrio alkaliphilus]